MQSNNPVFRRSDAFNGPNRTNAYGNQTYAGNGAGYDGYGQTPPGTPTRPGPLAERMTIDSVVQKTAITLAVVIVTASLTWWWTGDITTSDENIGRPLLGAMMIGSFGAFALSMVNSFKRVISPALVLGFAAAGGRRPRCVQASSSTRPSSRTPGPPRRHRDAGGDRHLRRVRRHAGRLQVLQHQGRIEVPHLRGRRHVRHGRARAARRSCSGFFSNSIGVFGFGTAGLLFAVRSAAWCSASSC